jgi:hypothetical protein
MEYRVHFKNRIDGIDEQAQVSCGLVAIESKAGDPAPNSLSGRMFASSHTTEVQLPKYLCGMYNAQYLSKFAE